MADRDRVEFFHQGQKSPFMIHHGSMTPNKGEGVSIQGVWYQVVEKSFALDYSGTAEQVMCCCIALRKVEDE